jgi:hypothetical protein
MLNRPFSKGTRDKNFEQALAGILSELRRIAGPAPATVKNGP